MGKESLERVCKLTLARKHRPGEKIWLGIKSSIWLGLWGISSYSVIIAV